MAEIRLLSAPAARELEGLTDLLIDAVRHGASIGFLWPLPRDEAAAYWRGVFAELGPDFALWIAEDEGRIVATVQLARCAKANGRHRAEVQKLAVLSSHRGRGISRLLLDAAEAHARSLGCTTLVLDTEVGSVADTVYTRHGWRRAGEIPDYAGKPNGELVATAYFYKLLGAPVAPLELVQPARPHLASYVAALRTGWSDNNHRPEAAREALEGIENDADEFLGRQVDREARGPPITMPDGSQVPRLPGYILWMWDGEFCGSIGFRWQPGTTALPPYTLGHIGYAVVPWKRRRGYAKRALALMLERVREEGLAHVDITADLDNVASQRTIVANGGVLVERFQPPKMCGDEPKLRYRIAIE